MITTIMHQRYLPKLLIIILTIAISPLTIAYAAPVADIQKGTMLNTTIVAPCAPLYTDDGQAPPYREVPPGPSEDELWPIIDQWKEVTKDKNGVQIVSTYVRKRNPNASRISEALASTSCSYVTDESITKTNTIQGITQRMSQYYYLYTWNSNGITYDAYWIYKTDEWWTRTSTAYTLGTNSTSWNYNGWNCSNVYSTNSSSGGVTPRWYDSTRTYHYIYDFTKNWVTKTPGPNLGGGLIRTRETMPAYKSGQSIGTLTTTIRLYGQ